MKSLLLTISAAAMLASACAPRVVLKQAESVSQDGHEYVYFIEQEKDKSSRIRMCTVQTDNKAVCSIQYEPKSDSLF